MLLQDLNIPAKLFYGDGFKGLPAYAPFDRILVTCGAREVPVDLLAQLTVGGVMVIPLGPEDEQVMTTYLKKGHDDFEVIRLEKFRFVPMLANKAP